MDNATSNYVMNNQRIYVRTTSATSFTDNAYPGTSGFTQVFNGTITYNGTSGWKEITFASPFSYNGTDNLEVLFENRDGSWASDFPLFRYSTASSNRVKRDYQDASFPSSCSNCASFANIPNVKFTIDRTLNTFVKWQYSYDDNTYNDLAGGTTSTYSTFVNTSTYFRAQFTNGSCNAFSSPVFYATNNNYYVNDNSTSGDIYTTAVGSAANDGRSPLKPKASINDVLATYTLSSCDTIFVDKGTYSEEVNFTSSDAGNGNGYVVVEGAGIDVSTLTAPTNKNNIVLNQSNYIKIEKFTLNSTQSTYNNIKIQSAAHNLITNNKLAHSTSTNINLIGAAISSNQNEISNNQISNSSTTGYGISITGNSDSVLISQNSITMSNAGSVAGIYITSSTIGSNLYYPALGVISQNTITAQNYGIKLYGPDYSISTYSISNNTITINTKSQTDGSAIWLGSVGSSSSDKTLIFNNRLIGGSNGLYLSGYVDYTRIYNNYISGSDNGIYVSSSSSDVGEIYFNSFYNSTNNLYFASSSGAYWKIKNNILYNTNNSASNACLRIGNTGVTFDACNYNLFYVPNGASIGRLSSTNYTTLATWKNIDHADETAKGDENSVYGNPLYVNAASNNLDVVSSSPAAASGTVISGITKDIYNTTRQNPPFIGAQEIPFSVAICNTQTITCAIPSATLTGTTASSGVSFSWVGPTTGTPAGSSPSSSLTVVSAAGIYTLTATKSGNTPITSTVQVVSNQTLPNVSAGANQTISCTNTVAILTGTSTTSDITYSWTPAGSSSTSYSTSATSAGTYTLRVTNTVNGCTNSSTVFVASPLSSSASIIDYENDSLKGQVSLCIMGGVPPYNVAWNGAKIPSSTEVYHSVIDSIPGVIVDSVQFKNDIDNIKQRTVFNNIEPGSYPVIIYDQSGDSLILNISVGVKISNWAAINGVNISPATANTNHLTIGNVNYYYSNGLSVTQQGSFSTENNYALPLSHIDLSESNEMGFVMTNPSDIAYVGIQEEKLTLNGAISDLSQKTMFRFNGNGTYDIIFQGSSIYNGTISSGDRFSLKTNIISGKITYYKNEVQVAQSDIALINTGTYGFIPKIVFGSINSKVIGLAIKGPVIFLSLNPVISNQIIDATCDNSCSGEIKISATSSFISLPGTFSINTGQTPIHPTGTNNFIFSDLCPGTYALTYTYQRYDLGTQTYNATNILVALKVAYKLDWTNVHFCSIDGNTGTLQKNATGTAGASSYNILSQSSINTEWIEFKTVGSGNVALGLSTVDQNQVWTSIKHSILILPYVILKKDISAIQNITPSSYNSSSTNTYRFEKTASSLKCYINNQLLTTYNPVSTADYIVDASILGGLNPKIVNPRVSFDCGGKIISPTYAKLHKQLDGGYYSLIQNKLLVEVKGDYISNNLTYKVYDNLNNLISSNTVNPLLIYPSQVLSTGDNKLTIDVSSGIFSNGFYVLEVVNEKNEKQYLRFKK